MKNKNQKQSSNNVENAFLVVQNVEKIQVMQLIEKISQKIMLNPKKAAIILSLWINQKKSEPK